MLRNIIFSILVGPFIGGLAIYLFWNQGHLWPIDDGLIFGFLICQFFAYTLGIIPALLAGAANGFVDRRTRNTLPRLLFSLPIGALASAIGFFWMVVPGGPDATGQVFFVIVIVSGTVGSLLAVSLAALTRPQPKPVTA